MAIAIEFDHVGKQYRLGTVGTGTLHEDLRRFWEMKIMHREDPYLKIGQVNDRSESATSNYVWALRDIDFKIEQGDVVGIIGKNGAGKSTLLKLLSRVTNPTTGIIRSRGRIASLLEVGTGFHGELTGRENIYINGAILGMTKAEINSKLDEIIHFSGCEKYIDTPVKRYSSGMTVRLGFAVAAFLDPEILVVDEVLAVGDAEFQKKAIGKMQDVSQGEGRTVLFVSHNMASIKNLCTTGVLLDNGMVSMRGDIDDVVEEYLTQNLREVGDIGHVEGEQLKRISVQTKDIEIMALHREMPYCIDNFDDIHIKAIVQRNNSAIGKFQFATMIDDVANGGERVGMAVSEEVVWQEGKEIMECDLHIPNTHLAQGKYILDVWTCTGDITSSYKYYDAVYDSLTFKVETYNRLQIAEWHNYWGTATWPMNVKV